MSNIAIRAALETAVKALPDNLPTAWQNVAFAIPDAPYQRVDVLFATPENPTLGDGFYRQRGFMQISLRYPVNEGSGDSAERGEMLRRAFRRGLSLEANGVTTIIDRTPHVPEGVVDGDRFVVNVRITFYADIMGA